MLRLVTLYQINCKGTIKFADMQILSAKSFRSFKGNEAYLRFSTRAERGVRKKEIRNH